MSGAFIPSTAGASAAATAAAAAKARREREEEEKMTKYNDDDLKGWEFKILRSARGKFGKQQFFQQILQEEAKAGWELVEKFDNHRIRFKRRIERRSNDQFLDFDPYRNHIGLDSKRTEIIIGVSIALLLGGIFAFLGIFLNSR